MRFLLLHIDSPREGRYILYIRLYNELVIVVSVGLSLAFLCLGTLIQGLNLDTMEIDDMTCEDMGFDPEKVHCSGCDKMKQHIKDDKLVTECYDCCVEDRKRYGQASLQVCKEGLKQMEDLRNFIEKDASNFANLKVKAPTLILCCLNLSTDRSSIQSPRFIWAWQCAANQHSK